VQPLLADGQSVGCGASGEAVGADELVAVELEPTVLLQPGGGLLDPWGVAAGGLDDV
jgi:hypothetical protein